MHPDIHALVLDPIEWPSKQGSKVRLAGRVLSVLLQEGVDLRELRNVRQEVDFVEVGAECVSDLKVE